MQFFRHLVQDSSHAGEIRRQAALLAQELALNETEIGKVSIVIHELCSNILKHAKSGEIFLIKNEDYLEILALDKGPGMRNVHECLRDGFSTHGTSGTGLGAIKRLATHFDLYTSENRGTAIYLQFKLPVTKKEECPLEIASIMVPYGDEKVSGDGWSLLSLSSKRHKILMSDGLGHGILANEASSTAIQCFQKGLDRTPLADISALHNALRSTRGAAVAVADLHLDQEKLDYAALGNISATLVSQNGVKKLITYNGTAGVQFKKLQPMSYLLEPGWVFILHSDGLATHWHLSEYPGLLLKHPTLIAGILYRDFARKTDDVSVVVLRIKR